MAWSKLNLLKRGGAEAAERRRHKRFSTDQQLSCPLGEVIDLSISGMRLRNDQRPPVQLDQQCAMTIASGPQQLQIMGRIARLQRRGHEGFDIGVEFVGLRREDVSALETLSRFGFIDEGGAGDAGSPPKRLVQAMVDNPYRLLGVPPNATPDAIHQAYRNKARQCHPDISDLDQAAHQFKQIHDAYSMLIDPAQRQVFDRLAAG